MKTLNYKHTIYACFTGYVVQAIINNFIPLLFLTFQSSYGIPLSKITFLVTFNFGLQLVIDFLSAGFVDKIGYRISIILAHVFAAAGLIGLTVLPELFRDPFTGLLLSVVIYAVGGGLTEVLISPIMESCPTDNKETAMSLLHSFYCWGHVAVVLFSTVFFRLFGIENWKILALIWTIVPVINGFLFAKVPIAPLLSEEEESIPLSRLMKQGLFWILLLLMFCAGSCEQAVSQWASTFAEKGLQVSKTIGDLTGPMMFAILMGISRAIYGKYGDKIDLMKFMTFSGILCLISYLLISLTASPVIGLIGCGLCGLSVGILWPGTFSISAARLKAGGTAMFALLALAGDVGCSLGPTTVGIVSGWFQDNLRMGILVATAFPVLLLLLLTILKNMKGSQKNL
ncbi:MAG: MFS transporter [Lachnospiraceae bacterium]|nr:MFS transporter [Lachnospiraceae bacterium]